jgi:DNA-binding XRE family transcriptional regulator
MIGKDFREVRNRSGLSRELAAAFFGVCVTTITKMETGKMSVLPWISECCRWLEPDCDYFKRWISRSLKASEKVAVKKRQEAYV